MVALGLAVLQAQETWESDHGDTTIVKGTTHYTGPSGGEWILVGFADFEDKSFLLHSLTPCKRPLGRFERISCPILHLHEARNVVRHYGIT